MSLAPLQQFGLDLQAGMGFSETVGGWIMSEALPLKTRLRADDLLGMDFPGKGKVELWDGELVEMSPNFFPHSRLLARLYVIFGNFAAERSDIEMTTESLGFLLRREPDTLLSPDLCLVEKLPTAAPRWMERAPFLAIEVLSASNTVTEIMGKAEEFQIAGTEQFWIVDGPERRISIMRKNGPTSHHRSGILRGDGIVDGLEIDLDKLFAGLE